jgi:hypothetical protein
MCCVDRAVARILNLRGRTSLGAGKRVLVIIRRRGVRVRREGAD